VTQVKDGSEAAFRRWVAECRDVLRHSAFVLCADWYLADDLVQESLVRLYSVWDRVARRGDPKPYTYRILVNLHRDHLRRASSREVVSPHLEVDQHQPDVAAGMDYLELLEALRAMPPGQRSVIALRFLADLSIEQTATALGTSPGNVKSQASRGLATLRSAMTGDPVRRDGGRNER
jgi:RNA polymerase sigma-70 factor (sigma-E family)